jgi:putative addiction module killer protein
LFSVEQTSVFERWLAGLRDQGAYTRVRIQLLRFGQGNFGDVKPVGEGVSETRLHFGPGYRLYFCKRGDDVILLLAGGDKSSQTADIRQAIALKREIEGR